MHQSGRRASYPGPGPSNISPVSSSPTTPISEPVSLPVVDNRLARSWHSWTHTSHHDISQTNLSAPSFDMRWDRTRLRVFRAVSAIIHIAGDEVLPVAAEALSLAPVPALAPAAKILDSIWKSLTKVQTNRSACLRLTDRCATLLMLIHDAVSASGDAVAHELEAPLEKLEQSFADIDRFFKEQAERSFIDRYIHREEIREQIVNHDKSIDECLNLFNLRVNLSHMAVSLRMERQQFTPPGGSMLLSPDETNPPSPSPISETDTDAFHLTNFEIQGTPEMLHGDGSTLNEELRITQSENEADQARDDAELRRVLRSALYAPDNRTVTHILQIPSADMSVPAMMTALLRELERRRNEPLAPAGSSPSPRIRTLTWPVDGVRARQVELLDRQFVEVALEALKRTENCTRPASPSVITGAFERVVPTDIQVQPPCNSSMSAWSGETGITTPLSTVPQHLPPHDHSALDDPTIDPSKAATEIRYRLSLSHAFHHLSVTLPLWTPSLVALGAVGYLEKPTGAFRTLFNCRDPDSTSNGRLSGFPKLSVIPTVIFKPNPDRAHHLRGIIDRFTQNQRTYPVLALGETAHLIAEKAEHHYFERLDELKQWFRANIQAVVDAYHPAHLKEEIFLVVGTLNARDHALLVNHGGDDPEEVSF
ncbi:Protein kinase domain-containing protein [Mycena sanguinolenta]|uniref:Protein kinase domain-containing protein n=1 Tax=Mycena sanguinolenta TaxID=230812 RepID=A0A8H6Z6S2_9AGAR|nr:Protein kinase domain-containing protein [Mycena sanguinolenta]